MNTLVSSAGNIELAEATIYNNELFGYTLYENLIDPANPQGPRIFAVRIPAGTSTRAWMFVEPDYHETVEVIQGSAKFVINRNDSSHWEVIQADKEDPFGSGLQINSGDAYAIVAEPGEDVITLGRPSKPFEDSFEAIITRDPNEDLMKFIGDLTTPNAVELE